MRTTPSFASRTATPSAAAPPASLRLPSAIASNPVQTFGFFFLAFYVFLIYGRVQELLSLKLGVTVPLMQPAIGLSLLLTVLAWRFSHFFRQPAGLLFFAYLAWMMLSLPFSIWKGGSVPFVIYQWKMTAIFVATVGLIRSTRDVRIILYTILVAAVIICAVAWNMTGMSEDNRFAFEGGTLANPNELANHLLIALPLCGILGFQRSTFSLGSVLRVAFLALAAAIIVKTGSRGGIVMAGSLGLLVFLFSSTMNRLKFAGAAIVLVIVSISAMPQVALERYRTLFAKSDAEGLRGEALHSTRSRTELLYASIGITLRNPLFGVGPGNFVVAYNDQLANHGLHHHWEVTHNAFTQISSEIGVPALSFYLACFALAIRGLWRIRRMARSHPGGGLIAATASALLLSIAAFLLSGLFTSNAHQFYYPLLIGLAMTFEYYARQELGIVQPAFKPPLPAAPPFRGRQLPIAAPVSPAALPRSR